MSTRSTMTKPKLLLCTESLVTICAKKEGTLIPGAISLKNHQLGIGLKLMYVLTTTHEHPTKKIVSMIVLKEDLLTIGAIQERLHGIIVLQRVFSSILMSEETSDLDSSNSITILLIPLNILTLP